MSKINPYEYHNGELGVQARFIFTGRNMHKESLQLIGYRGLAHRINSEALNRLRPQAPGQSMLLSWDSLPVAWQNLLIKSFGNPPEQVRQSLFEKHYKRDTAAFDFYSLTFTFDDGSPLSDSKVDEYTINASVLNTIKAVYSKRHAYRQLLKDSGVSAWDATHNEAQRFRDKVQHTLPTNSRRLRDTFNKYKKEGYLSLVSKQHGNNNARVVTPEIEVFINSMFADYAYKPNKAEVARQYNGFLAGYVEVINNETGEIYQPSDFPRLGVSTVTTYMSMWHNAIATEHIRGGDRQKLMTKFKPYHSLEQPSFAGSIISIDDRQPPFEYDKNRRMWFYNGIDLGSEAFVCWVYGKTKEGIIVEFYRQLVRNYAQWGLNLPDGLEAESSLNSSFKDTFLREGNMFQNVRIEANNARGKRIEAYYRPLRYKHEKKREGWLARPFARSEANQVGAKPVPMIPYNEIVQGCLRDIETWNNTEHSTIKGKTRWEVFIERQHKGLRPTNYRGIIPYLGYKTETSCNAGIINLQGGEYLLGNGGTISVGASLVSLMTKVEGRNINVRWLDGNQGEILKAYVYFGDEYVCEAVAKPTYNRAVIERTPQCEVNRELMSAYVATIEGYRKRRTRDIERLTVIDNTPQTLNGKFQIDGVVRYTPRENEVEILPNLNEFETEIEYPLNNIKAAEHAALKDRF